MKKLILLNLLLFSSACLANSESVNSLNKACDGGDAEACRDLGYKYKNGNGVRKDYFVSAEYYKQSCDGGDAFGCNNLGYAYENGEGVRQSYGEALRLFGLACDLKEQWGCDNYARLKKSGVK